MIRDFDRMPVGPNVESIGFFAFFYLIYFLFVLTVAVAAYVLRAWGMYSIAKRRGIRKPWLAWIPVGDMWLLGCVSDQYQYVVKGTVKNKRKSLLTLSVLMWTAFGAAFILLGMFLGSSLETLEYWDGAVPNALMSQILFYSFGALVLFLVSGGLAIAIVVLQYMALYDLFSSCEPQNNVLYLVLTVFFPALLPVFLFVCRKKDLGMPPRKPESWEASPEV